MSSLSCSSPEDFLCLPIRWICSLFQCSILRFRSVSSVDHFWLISEHIRTCFSKSSLYIKSYLRRLQAGKFWLQSLRLPFFLIEEFFKILELVSFENRYFISYLFKLLLKQFDLFRFAFNCALETDYLLIAFVDVDLKFILLARELLLMPIQHLKLLDLHFADQSPHRFVFLRIVLIVLQFLCFLV